MREERPERAGGSVRLLSYPVPCAACGYDLVGLPVEGVCPECSHSVRASIVRVGRRDPGPLRKVDRAKCVGCGYDLNGLRLDGVCPECAMPVERSMRGVLLRNAPIEYLRKLSSAGSLLRALVWLVPVSVCFSPLSLGAMACWGVGWWMVTMPDPELGDNAPGDGWRRIARALVPTVLLGLFALATVSFLPPRAWGGAPLVEALAVLMVLSAVAQHEAGLLFVRALARRVPDLTLRARAGWLLWVGPVPALIWLGREAAILAGVPPSMRPDGVIVPVGLAMFVVWLVGYLALTSRIAAILGEEYVYAKGLRPVSASILARDGRGE